MMRVRLSHIICFLFFAFMAGHAAAADDLTVAASVDRSRVMVGDHITYTLKISGTDFSGASLAPPDFSGFVVRGRQGPVNQTIIVNGVTERNVVYSWSLTAVKEGAFTIPPTRVERNGNIYESSAVTVNVVKDALEDLPSELSEYNIIQPRTNYTELNKQLRNRVFVLTVPGTTNPYVGEPVEITYYLYKENLQLSRIHITAEPEYRDFLNAGVVNPNVIFRQRTLGDRTYDVAAIRNVTLVPTHPGTFDLGTLELGASIEVSGASSSRTRSPFGDSMFDSFFDDPFFNRNLADVAILSSPVTLEVKSLPDRRPADFSGTVGDYTITAHVDFKSVTTDDIVTLEIAIRGRGYVDSAAEPELPKIDGMKVVDAETSVVADATGEGAGKIKRFSFLLRPERPGTLTIPEVSYTVFNPYAETYETLETKPIVVSATKGKEQSPLVMSSAPLKSSEGIVTIGEGLNYIKLNEYSPALSVTDLMAEPWMLGLHLVPFIALGVGVIVRKRRDSLEADVAMARHSKARNAASRRLRKAARIVRSDDASLFYSEISNALRGYLGDKLNRSMFGLHIEEISRTLESRGIAPDTVGDLEGILETCAQANYAPKGISAAEREQLYKDAAEIINRLERVL